MLFVVGHDVRQVLEAVFPVPWPSGKPRGSRATDEGRSARHREYRGHTLRQNAWPITRAAAG